MFVVIKAATKIESNLRKDLDKKVEKAIDAKLKMIDNRIKELIIPDLFPMKESLNQVAIKQAQCISRDEAQSLIVSSRAQLTQTVTRLDEHMMSLTKKVDSTSNSFDKAINKLTDDREKILHHLQHFVTKDDASNIAEDICNEQFSICMSKMKDMEGKGDVRIKSEISEIQRKMSEQILFATKNEATAIAKTVCSETYEQFISANTHSIRTQIDECKAQLSDSISIQLRKYITKDEARDITSNMSEMEAERCFEVIAGRCHSTESKIVDLEVKLHGIESDFDREIFKLLNVVKSIDDQVQSMGKKYNDQLDISRAYTMNNNALGICCVTHDDIQREKENSEVNAASSSLDIAAEETDAIQSPPSVYIQDPKTSQHSDIEPSKSVDDDKSESTPESSCTSIGSPCHSDSSNENEEDDKQQNLIHERNRMLSHVARTLSAVATKRDDSSLRQLAAEMRAGKLATDVAKVHDPESYAIDAAEGRLSGMFISTQSDAESIDTADAMSLCGVQLDESNNGTRSYVSSRRIDSPTSFVGTIDTAEAISLCRCHIPSDQCRENTLSGTEEDAYTLPNATDEQQSMINLSAEKKANDSIEISCTKSQSSVCISSNDDSSSSSSMQDLKSLVRLSSNLGRAEIRESQEQSHGDSPSNNLHVESTSAIASYQSEHTKASSMRPNTPSSGKQRDIAVQHGCILRRSGKKMTHRCIVLKQSCMGGSS